MPMAISRHLFWVDGSGCALRRHLDVEPIWLTKRALLGRSSYGRIAPSPMATL
jgi:hypothetical protein